MTHKRIFFLPCLLGMLSISLSGWQGARAAESVTPHNKAGERAGPVASGDLHMAGPARRPEHGLPLGNGRMGSMVWTTPGAIHLQINRPDVYANDRNTTSFKDPHENYCGGCAFVDLDFGAESNIFSGATTRQDLSIYNGLATLSGERVTARLLANPNKDVIAIEIDDARDEAAAIRSVLRMLRPASVSKAGHSATSELREKDGRIVLTQEFKEGQFVCRTAVAVSCVGAPSSSGPQDATSLRLCVGPWPAGTESPAKGHLTIYVASAASFEADREVATTALQLCADAEQEGFARLAEEAASWWHRFWQGTYVKLSGTNGAVNADAAMVQANYYYYLYLMAASSRGPLPPKFNGMLWNTRGDFRRWGDMHWWHNLSCFYDALPATGKWELLDPVYDMYSGMLPSCERAAKETWGSAGVWIPETVHFNGLPTLPPEIATELREFLLCRKPVAELSESFKTFASLRNPLHPYWNYLAFDCWKSGQFEFRTQGHGPFSYTTHILSSGTKIAQLFWARYAYTRDTAWLRNRAYPVIRGTAEFYRNFPNLKLAADGKYHIYNVNNHEPTWNTQDAIGELGAMYAILPVAIRAAEILGVDAGLREKWADLLAKLAPLPTTDHPLAIHPRQEGKDAKWDVGLQPVAKAGRGGIEPVIFYDLYTCETADPRMTELAAATYGPAPRSYAPGDVGPLGLHALMAAHMGRGEDMGAALVSQLTDRLIYPNRLCDVEGDYQEFPGTTAEHEGRAVQGLLRGLLLAAPPAPGQDPVVRLFGALPAAWDGEFQLLAPGGFAISAVRTRGVVPWVTVESHLGETLRLRNPWPGSNVKVSRFAQPSLSIQGDLLTIPTASNEAIVLTEEQAPVQP
ncbi:MAG: hypothetical protein WCO57_07370 [Verrucomicrobiota bacterium]